MQQQGNKVCLTMIVKNESKIIERLLTSCLPIIDCLCISDTGSTDNTTEIISAFAERNKLPYHIARCPFRDFGYNRTLSVEESRTFLRKNMYDLSRTWLLLLDADMKLEIKSTFNKALLKESGYNIMQKNFELTYENTRLIKASVLWTCIGVTHEYWNCPEGNTVHLDWLEIDDIGDGGAKADKFPRDIRLLEADLKENPGNGRSMFYLAQTYQNSGATDKAINMFKQRIDKGGWDQETWYCMFQMGRCFMQKGDPMQATYWYQEAYNFRPIRAEPLLELSKYYRMRGKNHSSYLFARKGIEIAFPKGDLFVNHTVYEYELLYELSIVSAYIAGKERDGYVACDRLIQSPTVTDHIRHDSRSNLWFYLKPLPCTAHQEINVETFPLFEGNLDPKQQYNPMNPCILSSTTNDTMNDTEHTVLLRTVNYKQEKGIYTYRDGSGIICTKNLLLRYDSQFSKVKSRKPVVDKVGGEILSLVYGIEDMRIFRRENGELWSVGGNRITHDTPQIVLMKLEETDTEVHITRKILLIGPKGIGSCEKNWMPFIKKENKNKIYFIYQHEPIQILSVDLSTLSQHTPIAGKKVETCICNMELEYEMPNVNLEFYRGSCPPIPWENGKWISIVHEVLHRGERERVYVHRFIIYNSEMIPMEVTLPFYFQQKGIEYVAGLSIHNENFHITYGKDDATAHISSVPISTVKQLFYKL